MSIKKNVMIKLLSYRTEIQGSLFEEDVEEIEELAQILEGEYVVEFSGELSLDMSVSDVAEMIE